MITLTEAAKSKFLQVTEAEGRTGQGLRVVVRGGATARPEFALNFVEPGAEIANDVVVESNGIRVHMDPESARYLEGATIDFVDELTQSGFKVDAPKAGLPKPEGPVAQALQSVLDAKINPAVAAHGGHVSLVAVDGDTAVLRFGGGCQGCGMINVTLKQGVERIIFEDVPEIKRVLDVTDHASGSNPYYQPAK